MSRRWVILWGLIFAAALALPGAVQAVERFPPPDFTSGYQKPTYTTPPPRAFIMQYGDLALLAGALGLASWLAVRRRSRNAMLALSIFSLAYFGFYRNGCVCAIGSIQNVALAVADRGYAIPLVVLGFFLLPLLTALFFGRTFCAAVCPHGALQDLVLVKPVRVPGWLEKGLGVIPYAYLAGGVLLAATGSAFVLCQYDPFVAIFRYGPRWPGANPDAWVPVFRVSGGLGMLIFGVALLVLGMFVGRPYCRFLCPYGAILRQLSRLSQWHLSITPKDCINCRLCEDACPYGAIEGPTAAPVASGPSVGPGAARRRLALLLLLVPVCIAAAGFLGSKVGPLFVRLHPAGQNVVRMMEAGEALDSPEALAQIAVARGVRRGLLWGGWAAGGFVGLVVGVRLVKLSVYRRRTQYDPERGACVSCARCLTSCPKEPANRLPAEVLVPLQLVTAAAGSRSAAR